MDDDTIIRLVSLVLNVVQSIALAYIAEKYRKVMGKSQDEE